MPRSTTRSGSHAGLEVDFELGNRPRVDRTIKLTLQPDRRAGDEKPASDRARRVCPWPLEDECGNRSRRFRLEFQPINRRRFRR